MRKTNEQMHGQRYCLLDGTEGPSGSPDAVRDPVESIMEPYIAIMTAIVRWCLTRVAYHVNVMWSYMDEVKMNKTHEQINGSFQCLGQGPWAKQNLNSSENKKI